MNTDNLNKQATSELKTDTSPLGSRLIGKVLSPALKLFLRSQLEQVSHLEVKIIGSDRQIFTGSIPQVIIWANHAIYQGLHLTQVQLVGNGICINLGQVLKGQPLRLVEPVLVYGELLLHQADLNASLHSRLLSDGLTELLQLLLPANYSLNGQVSWRKITLASNHLTLIGDLATSSRKMSLLLSCGLQLVDCHELLLTQIQLQAPDINQEKLDLSIDLGSQVNLQELTLHSGKLVCRGSITVMP